VGAVKRTELDELADALYERYGRPLEAEHQGEYLAVSPRGDTLVGPTLLDVLERATDAFGPGNYLFKIGEKAVGRWR
jgi:hypothetical protein